MVRLIIWVIVGLLALSFFGISLESLYNSPTNQENMSFLMKLLAQGWNHFADFFNMLIEMFVKLIPGNG